MFPHSGRTASASSRTAASISLMSLGPQTAWSGRLGPPRDSDGDAGGESGVEIAVELLRHAAVSSVHSSDQAPNTECPAAGLLACRCIVCSHRSISSSCCCSIGTSCRDRLRRSARGKRTHQFSCSHAWGENKCGAPADTPRRICATDPTAATPCKRRARCSSVPESVVSARACCGWVPTGLRSLRRTSWSA